MSNPDLSPGFHEDKTIPEGDWVWVFGSNEAGRHGMGAAKVAKTNFGAKYGVGRGPVGQSYAIATKDANLKTLPLEVIERSIRDFVQYAQLHPELNFFVTRIGCELAGYSDDQIAPMFNGLPSNCSVAKEWKMYFTQSRHAYSGIERNI